MKRILILGGGSAGTMMANHLNKKIDHKTWEITVVDQNERPLLPTRIFISPFGTYSEKDVVKKRTNYLPATVEYVQKPVDRIVTEENKLIFQDESTIGYDLLIIATGSRIAPEEIEGMAGELWHKEVFDFYTFEGAVALRDYLKHWEGGKMVVHITEMPIKCPVAPLEFSFLADDFFKRNGIRDQVDITYVTPLDGAFTKPTSSKKLGYLLKEKGVNLVTDFAIERVDNENKKIVSTMSRK